MIVIDDFTVNSLVVSDDKIGFKYLDSKYVSVFIADKIGRNIALLLTTFYVPYGYRIKFRA